MAKNGRPPGSVRLFRDAALEQDLDGAVWAILYAMRDAVGRGDMDAVSLKLVEQLVILERTRIQYGGDDKGTDEGKEKSATAELLNHLASLKEKSA